MMKPNDFCVNDVNHGCIWGCLTDWETLNDIQKKREGKIVFEEIIEERGEGSRYVWLLDDEMATNYFVKI